MPVARKEYSMQDLICPLDGQPCEKDCPDRYIDQPEGGCFLTTAQELGASVFNLPGQFAGIMFTPKSQPIGNLKSVSANGFGQKDAAASASNTDSGEETTHSD